MAPYAKMKAARASMTARSRARDVLSACRSATCFAAGISPCLLIAYVALLPSPATARAESERGRILYRFIPPWEDRGLAEMKTVRTYRDPDDNMVVEFRKPADIPGSRNVVKEIRFEDSTIIDIVNERGETLFDGDMSGWSMRSSATADHYYVMADALALTGEPSYGGKNNNNNFFEFSYSLILVSDEKTRQFDCVFDKTRLVSSRDKDILHARYTGDLGGRALYMVARFLSEHGEDMRADGCTPRQASGAASKDRDG